MQINNILATANPETALLAQQDAANLTIFNGNICVQISSFLASAESETAVLAQPGATDLTVTNGNLCLAHAAVRAFLAHRWAVEPQAQPCHVIVEDFNWYKSSPHPTVRRLRHVAETASMLSLPRGRHLLRIVPSSGYLHRLSVWSKDPFKLDDAPGVLPQENVHLLEAEGVVPTLTANPDRQPSAWLVLCRHSFSVPTPCRVSISFRAAPAAALRCMSVVLVDNETSSHTPLPLSGTELLPMQPNAGGYTVVALMHAAEATPAGAYRLRITSDSPLAGFSEVPSSRCERLSGVYKANSRAHVCCCVLTAAKACQLSLRLSSSLPGAHGFLELLPVAADAAAAAGSKAKGRPAAQAEAAPLAPRTPLPEVALPGNATVPVLSVPAGSSVLSFKLDPKCCTFIIAPDGSLSHPSTDTISSQRATSNSEGGSQQTMSKSGGGVELAWELFLAPTADEKACTIALDTSVAAMHEAQLRRWVEGGAGGAKERPKRGEAVLARHIDAQQRAAESGAPLTVVRFSPTSAKFCHDFDESCLVSISRGGVCAVWRLACSCIEIVPLHACRRRTPAAVCTLMMHVLLSPMFHAEDDHCVLQHRLGKA